MPLHGFLGLSGEIPPTDFTIGIDRPDVVAERAARAARFPALKIKVGGTDDLATLEAVRAVYDGPIRVDANTGWQPDAALALLPALERLGVELIEQPFPAHRRDQLRWLQERSALPIVADESAVVIDDLEGLVGVVAGVNVKLAKCGGVGPAHRMLARARELGFRTFLGCMEETSVGIAASAAVASLADWVDLDGNLLLADDPFEGIELGFVLPLAAAGAGGPRRFPAWELNRFRDNEHGDDRTPVRVDNFVDQLVEKPSSGAAAAGLRCAPRLPSGFPGGAKPEGRTYPDRGAPGVGPFRRPPGSGSARQGTGG